AISAEDPVPAQPEELSPERVEVVHPDLDEVTILCQASDRVRTLEHRFAGYEQRDLDAVLGRDLPVPLRVPQLALPSGCRLVERCVAPVVDVPGQADGPRRGAS